MNEDKLIDMTIKELVTLDKEGKLVPYPGKYPTAIWDDESDKIFINNFINSKPLGHSLHLNLTQEGVYQIVDGKHRISLLLEFGKSLDVSELETYKEPVNIILYPNWSLTDLQDIYLQAHSRIPLKRAQLRSRDLIKENFDLLEELLTHDFFKNCYNQEENTKLAAWECMEILLAYIQHDFTNTDKVTLPSSLEKFTTKKMPYNKMAVDVSFLTLSLMEKVFKGKNYVCRAIDYICMAMIVLLDKAKFQGRNDLSESENQLLFEEYIKMWNDIEPCITLNPLAKENIDMLTNYMGLIIDKVRDKENSILGYRERKPYNVIG
jgi:hypothetical protein